MSLATRTLKGDENIFYYYLGKIRVFCEDRIFFTDQRNVAVVSIDKLYINGKKATKHDVEDLQLKVMNSTWQDSTDLYSYVKIYKNPPDWPYNFSGKFQWLASYAWIGSIPELVEEEIQQQNAIYMPLSYYTGKPFKYFKDKILFGDQRNSVMVLKENLYIYGERCGSESDDDLNGSDPLIHSYIIKLNVLAEEKYGGPEPHLPTWPKGNYGPDTWVARFAWQGDMPNIVRHQISRFCVIGITDWEDLDSITEITSKRNQGIVTKSMRSIQEHESNFSKCRSIGQEIEGVIGVNKKSKRIYTRNSPESKDALPVMIPIQQYSGLMKGSLMMADQEQGLMTSFVDVIAFTKEEFYINEIKFKRNASLCNFFQDRKVPLMAWVVPMMKPKVIFNVLVAWRAICVWFGNTPKNLNHLKNIYDEGQFEDNLSQSSEAIPCKRLTHFMGVVTNLSFASGVLQCKVTPKLTVKIAFKRRALYIYGYRFQTSCSLLDKQQTIESYTWSVLAYPMQDNKTGFPPYCAVAVWQYQYQHLIINEILLKAISKENEQRNTDLSGHVSTSLPVSEEWGRHMSGWVINIKPRYGILQSGSIHVDATYSYFDRSVFYLDGEIVPRSIESLKITDKSWQCNMYAKPVCPILLDGHTITMEATLVWIGRKPVDILKASTKVVEKGDHLALSTCSDNISKGAIDVANSYRHMGELGNGNLLMADESNGLMTSCGKIIYFFSDIFYVHGEKFSLRPQSLYEYLHSKKVDIKAWILPLEEPRVILSCIVTHQAIYAWIGQEPDDLRVAHLKQKGLQDKSLPLTLKSTKEIGLSYYTGTVSQMNLSSGVITCTNTEEPVKAIFKNHMLFINGERLNQENSELQGYMSKILSSLWCLLAYAIPPRNFLGEQVNTCAVAVWQHDNQYEICAELRNIINIFSKSTQFDTLDKNEVINKMAKISLAKADSQYLVAREDSAFVGKHISGKIIERTDTCGVIKISNVPAVSSEFVKFATTDIYVDLCPMSKNFSLENIQMRCVHFYAVPIQNQIVCGHTVSLLATCGWIGQKPSFIPSPGNQKCPRIDLNELQEEPVVDSGYFAEGHGMERSCKGFQESQSSRPGAQSKSIAKQVTAITSELSNLKTLSLFDQIHNNTKTVFGNSSERENDMGGPKASEEKVNDTVWDEFSRLGYLKGHIIEIHSNVGRLKGTDGSQLYFSREKSLLYGVTLRNVELWHVLVKGQDITYKLEAGTTKVQTVWIGPQRLKNKQKTEKYICEWCNNNLVPDGTKTILMEQVRLGIL
ncbi:uncharacterized protein LOC122249842 [Penaeus japonicus]|uniref:uncharacterized protein LOC122249842 n=1 Tax=Penaeus japonicus TaxID=27405 RepID=UPI001C7113A4|nr:uncharacterized protein LOC122249842 [Penaeus japonicus]XP_042866933.1 uncharacterized protein LOC122249842 [Penaeus japonicus]